MMLGLGLGLHKSNRVKSIVKNGLVLWLDGKDFKNSPPTNPWIDRSGLGNNATPSGFAYTTASGSNGASGVAFDGVDDKNIVVIPDYNDFTIDLCFKLNVTPSTANISLCGNSAYLNGGFQLGFNVANARLKGCIQGTSETVLSTTYDLVIGQYYYVTMSYSSSTNILKMYINGVLNASMTALSPKTLSVNSLRIGTSTQWANYCNFTMNSFKEYNRALTDTEILQNYNASR